MDLFMSYNKAMQIRNYKKSDEKVIFNLWNSNLKEKWAIDQVTFSKIINSSKKVKNIILEDGKKILGFISLEVSKEGKGSIKLILIEKKYQRKGLGTLLVNFGLEYLKNEGVKNVFLGSGGSSYFWPGVPENLSEANQFFKKHGWDYFEKEVDLVGNIKNFWIPKSVRFNKEVVIEILNKKDAKNLLKFEKKEFPYWFDYFASRIKKGEYKNILVAKNLAGEIVGSLLLFGPYGGKCDTDFKWRKIFGNQMGGFGSVGVSKKMREKGIGMAIVIKATEILKKRGVKNGYIGWTWLVDWYGKLGYKHWMSYQMGKNKV